jgi:hypothetical protein
MEIKFKKDTKRPVYDFAVKQEWEEHVYYECPAKLTEAEQKAIEKIARATFWALDCRDVARVDMRMDADGRIYVLEVNPLPGLTPGYSDLVLIAQAAGMEYDQLIAEIMVGGLRRMKDKRREERELEREREAQKDVAKLADKDKVEKKRAVAKLTPSAALANGNGTSGNGNGANGNGANANGNGTNANGTNANGTSGNGANGNGANANGGNSNGANANGGNGNGANANGGNGNGANANGGNGANANGNAANANGNAANATGEAAPVRVKRERSEPVTQVERPRAEPETAEVPPTATGGTTS